jgi:hypothetical protein
VGLDRPQKRAEKILCHDPHDSKEAAQKAASPIMFTQTIYWQRCIKPSSSLTIVPGWQTQPLRVA